MWDTVQYFTVPLPFLQESFGILRNPQEWHRNPQESTGILRNLQEWHGNPQEWDWNGTGIEWNETRKSIHLYTTDIIPLSDTFTLICLHTVTSRISTLCYNIYMLKFKWICIIIIYLAPAHYDFKDIQTFT